MLLRPRPETSSAHGTEATEAVVFGERRVVRAHDEAVRETLDGSKQSCCKPEYSTLRRGGAPAFVPTAWSRQDSGT